MKIALVLLACFVSLTWQQNVFWSFPVNRIPYYSTFNHDLPDDFPIVIASDPTGLQRHPNDYGHSGQHEVEQRTLKESNLYERLMPKGGARSFGINYLASLILSSLTLSSRPTSTSTTYTTAISTITAGTVATCFTNTMFDPASRTACRRKRDAMQMISSILADNNEDQNPSPSDKDALASEFKPLPREGRDVDPIHLITSSKIEKDPNVEFGPKQTESSVEGYLRQNRNVIVFTSTLTSFSVYYSTSTRTVTNIAAASSLLCLPSGFNLC